MARIVDYVKFSMKRDFFWGSYRKKGLGLFGGKHTKNTSVFGNQYLNYPLSIRNLKAEGRGRSRRRRTPSDPKPSNVGSW